MSNLEQPFTTTPQAIGAAVDDLSESAQQLAISSSLPVQSSAFARLSRFRAALASRRTGGASPVRVLFPGDSTSAGYGAVGSATYAGCAAKSFPEYVGQILNAGGITAQRSAFCGAGVDEFIAGSSVETYDPRVTLGAGWASTSVSQGVIGRRYILNSTTTNALSFAPGFEFDRIEIIHTNTGQFTVDIGGGVLSTINATAPLTRTTVNCTAGTNTVNIKRVGGDIYILAVHCYLSTGSAISIINGGCPGATTATVADANPFKSLQAIGVVGPSLSIISLGINDIAAGRTAAQFKTDLSTVIDKCQLTGDVILVSFIPFSNGNYATRAPEYLTALRQLESEKNCLFIDQTARFGSYASANSLGYYFDTLHPTAAGYYDFASAIAATIRRFI